MSRIYPGWIITGASFLFVFLIFGLPTFGFPVFYPEFVRDFGWTRAQVVGVMSSVSLTMVFTSPLIGWVVDRWGTARVLAIGTAFTVAGILSLTTMTSLKSYYVAAILVGIGLSVCSPSPLFFYVLRIWFKRRYGIATGLMTAATSFAGIFSPIVMADLIGRHGWRDALSFLLPVLAVFGFGLIVLAFRRTPNRNSPIFLWENGEELKKGGEFSGPEHLAIGGSVLRERDFWLACIVKALCLASLYFVISHIVLHLRGIGGDAGGAARTLSVLFGAALVSKLVLGWLSDVFNVKWFLLAASLLVAGTIIPLFHLKNADFSVAYALAVPLGLGYGGALTLPAVFLVKLFGRRMSATALGWLGVATGIGMGIVPFVGGVLFDQFGSYKQGAIIFTLLALVSGGLAGFLRGTPPVKMAHNLILDGVGR